MTTCFCHLALADGHAPMPKVLPARRVGDRAARPENVTGLDAGDCGAIGTETADKHIRLGLRVSGVVDLGGFERHKGRVAVRV